jgi:hypothetical protein
MDTADAYVESGHPGRLSIDDELELVGLRLSPPLLERIAAICELLHSALFGRKATPARTAYRAEQSTLAAILFNRLGRRDSSRMLAGALSQTESAKDSRYLAFAVICHKLLDC